MKTFLALCFGLRGELRVSMKACRLSGVGCRRWSICSLWMRPGARQFTMMPSFATSTDSPFAQTCTPALAAFAALTARGSEGEDAERELGDAQAARAEELVIHRSHGW